MTQHNISKFGCFIVIKGKWVVKDRVYDVLIKDCSRKIECECNVVVGFTKDNLNGSIYWQDNSDLYEMDAICDGFSYTYLTEFKEVVQDLAKKFIANKNLF